MLAHNSGSHASTGYSPFYLLHGFKHNQPIDLALLPNNSGHNVLSAL